MRSGNRESSTTARLPAAVEGVVLALDRHGGTTESGTTERTPSEAIALLARLRHAGIPLAVVSPNPERRSALRAAGILSLFDVVVDGEGVARPEPADLPDAGRLLRAARQLGVDPGGSAVIALEADGVKAARQGGFGMVIAVEPGPGAEALSEWGADAVVADLAQVTVTSERSPWRLVYRGFDARQEGLREALCATGNGYFASRGAAPEAGADGVRYPGTYVAGVFNRLATRIGGQLVENESLVNVPNWLVVRWRFPGERWFRLEDVELLDYVQQLDLRHGLLTRSLRFRDAQGRRTRLAERRFVSQADLHLGALEVTLSAENWAGRVEIRSALDGDVENAGVARYRALAGRHLSPPDVEELGPETIALRTSTTQSRILVAIAARTRLASEGGRVVGSRRLVRERAEVAHQAVVDVAPSRPVIVEKVVAVHTSRDPAMSEPGMQAGRTLERAGDFAELLESHRRSLRHLWDRLRIDLGDEERISLILNLHLFHLLQTVSENTVDLDVGIPARGLYGEAYRGHVFWDELFIFPFLSLNLPELARSLLRYRHRRLPEARRAALRAGRRGAMFPWQSGSDGREESQTLHLNPRSGRWLRDHSHLQRHIDLAIAYNVWQYHQATGDAEFLSFYGAPLLLEIARFWGSLAEYDPERARYLIRGVMGPDEYHDAYPWRTSPGLDNNAYTNLMAVWMLCRALELLDMLPAQRVAVLCEELDLRPAEIERWRQITQRMFVPFHDDGIISQFEGYERLEELDWAAYRERYGDIQRLDRILEAEGDTPNRFKASKQADVLMLFFLLPAETLEKLVTGLGYAWDRELIPRNIDYYIRRTSHGSTLSRIVHSWVLSRADRPGSWKLFKQALESDIADVQGGTTAEGVHLGAMAGTIDLVVRGFTGIELREDAIWFNPRLPREAGHLAFSIRYRGHWGLRVKVTDRSLRITVPPSKAPPVRIGYQDAVTLVPAGATFERALPPAPSRP